MAAPHHRTQLARKAATEMNRLSQAQSNYLRAHADQPVEWLPWSEEAFAMAKESFSDPAKLVEL